MINDPNYNLPKDAFIRLFDNPIPAGDPARSEAPEWAQELDEVVVWAHMGDNGEVSVKVNGEDIGGGGGGGGEGVFSTATLTLEGNAAPEYLPCAVTYEGITFSTAAISEEVNEIIVPYVLQIMPDQTLVSIEGEYEELAPTAYLITGDCTANITRMV